MKVSIDASLDGADVVAYFMQKLEEANIKTIVENIKIQVQKKDESWVDISPEKLKIIFNKE